MSECPVCRASVFGSPRFCGECGTPLGRPGLRKGLNVRRLTPLIPGLSHLWMGHLFTGCVALFGSFLSLIYLLVGPMDPPRLAWRLMYWGIFWVLWAGLWTMHVNKRRLAYPSTEQVVSYLFVMLLVANLFMTFLIAFVFFGS